MRKQKFLILAGALAFVVIGSLPAHGQFVSRDYRWPTRGPWMWAVPRELPKLYREFNGIDFGHAHLAQTLLRTEDQGEVEKARVEVLDFIFSSPPVPPDEEQVAPELVRLVWEVQRTFNWTHTLHRSLYDIYASDGTHDKDTAIKRVLADYLSKPEAITPHHLDHMGKLWSFPESKSFRDKFPKFNSQIWAYHWLQAAAYDVQLMGDAPKQRELMPRLIEHYHGYLRKPPLEWRSMPMIMEGSPEFAIQHPDAAAIFDNLHMIHDNLDDVISRPDLYHTRQAQRDRILTILNIYLHRNHTPEDKYAEYHMAMDDGMQHGGQGTQAASGRHGQQHGGDKEKGAAEKAGGEHGKLKDDIAPGKDHGGKSQGKEGDEGSSGHGGGGEKKPEHADWQKKQQEMQGMQHGGQGMQGMKGMGQMMMKMPPPPGPRPPSAKEVIEGKAMKMDGGGKEQKGHEHGGSAPSSDTHQESGTSVKLTETSDTPDLANRHSSTRTAINAANVRSLTLAWKLPLEHYVTHTPLLHNGRIYFTDWAGHAYAADAATGKIIWRKKLYDPEMKWAWHGLAGRGVIAEEMLIEASVEGNAYALDLNSGDVKWKIDFAPENKYAGSFNPLLFHEGLVYVGVSSVEEHIAEEEPKYKPTFRGKIAAINVRTGKIAWQCELVEKPSNGVAVWTTFALDPESGMLFATTGNNYTGEPSKYSDAMLALDGKSGEIRWAKQILERDVWTPAEPIGPDFDFAGGPQLFEASINGSPRKLVGASQKSGIYWAFYRTNGEVVWKANVSYGGVTGGMHSDASVGDGVIYCWGNNAFDHGIDPADSAMNVAALDAATGKILWKKNKAQQSALTTAGFLSQDVYLVPSLDGKIHGYRTSDGQMIWHSPEVPGPMSSSLAVVGNVLFATSGMPKMFSYFQGENGVYAFTLTSDGVAQAQGAPPIGRAAGKPTGKPSTHEHDHR